MSTEEPSSSGAVVATSEAAAATSEAVAATSEDQAFPLANQKRVKDSAGKYLIRSHRASLKESAEKKKEDKKSENAAEEPTPGPSGKANLTQLWPNLFEKLSPITFQEMRDGTEDKVYEDKFIDVLIIDEPLILPGNVVAVLIEDKNKDITRLHIHNDKRNAQAEERFAAGCRLSLINPYVVVVKNEKARGGNPYELKNVEPTCLNEHLKLEKMCRFCGKGNAPKNCPQCDKFFYCSAECQKLDWSKLEHKSIHKAEKK